MNKDSITARRTPRQRAPAHLPREMDGCDITWVRTSVLAQYCNPFKGCWIELQEPLSVSEVVRELESGTEELQAPFTSWTQRDHLPRKLVRRQHARKVAWFARNGFQKPLQVDVGVPSLGCYPKWLVEDGNHRLAAALVRTHLLGEDPWLPLAVSGSVQRARELGLG